MSSSCQRLSLLVATLVRIGATSLCGFVADLHDSHTRSRLPLLQETTFGSQNVNVYTFSV